MIRKFNYTGRKRIERERVDIKLISNPDRLPSFDALIDLDGLDLPLDGAVYIEVYDKSSFMRFDFGTVARQVAPPSRVLVDLQGRGIFSFRVKVVDQMAKHGRVLAIADRLPPIKADGSTLERESLLGVDSRDLEDQIWRLDFSDDFPVFVTKFPTGRLGPSRTAAF